MGHRMRVVRAVTQRAAAEYSWASWPERTKKIGMHFLKDKILQHFGDRVKLEKLSKKRGLVLFSSSMLKDTALQMVTQRQRQRHITLVERLKSHTATSEALVMSQAKLA